MNRFTYSVLSTLAVVALMMVASSDVRAQDSKPASPRGAAATQVDGKWITIDYSRPILRGRRGIFSQGDSYGSAVLAGAPVWRLGANVTTQLNTEAMLHFGDKMVPVGNYTLFAELNATGWTLIVSNHKAKASYGEEGEGLWGAYGYTPEKDLVRIPMTLTKSKSAVDQLTIGFSDVTAKGGVINISWDDTVASASFTVAGM